MPTIPAKADISAPYPNPSNAVARAGFGKVWEALWGAGGFLGTTGNIADARTALGVPAANDAALTGNPTATTQASTDNSTRLATTAWAKFGFVASTGANGYIKFPAWLGGFIIQWGGANTGASGVAVTFPLAWPSGAKGVWVTSQVAGPRAATYQSLGATSFFMQCWDFSGTQQNTFVSWIAVGY